MQALFCWTSSVKKSTRPSSRNEERRAIMQVQIIFLTFMLFTIRSSMGLPDWRSFLEAVSQATEPPLPAARPCPDSGAFSPVNGDVELITRGPQQKVAKFTCNTGYTLVGEPTIFCADCAGTWTDEPPKCIAPKCHIVPTFDNETVKVTYCPEKDPPFDLGEYAIYKCHEPYKLAGGSDVRTCVMDGATAKFDGTPAICKLKCDQPDNPTNGEVRVEKTVAIYSCAPGHTLTGQSTRTCMPNGDWSGSAPHCSAPGCASLSKVENGAIVYYPDTVPPYSLGTNATYKCNSGFELSGGDTVRNCVRDKSLGASFDGKAPSCVSKCGSLGNPDNGAVSVSGATATYTCEPGHSLIGDQTRVCMATGKWSGSEPWCVDIEPNCKKQDYEDLMRVSGREVTSKPSTSNPSKHPCLAFVLDLTGSMATELVLAKRIISEFLRAGNGYNTQGCYMLVPFWDAGSASNSVGTITTAESGNAEQLNKFVAVVSALTLNRSPKNRDYPEYAFDAIVKALQHSTAGNSVPFLGYSSQIVVITDAKTKNSNLGSSIINTAKANGVCVHFFTSDRSNNDPTYQNVAKQTGGTITPFKSWSLADVILAYSSTGKCYTGDSGGPPPAKCQNFQVSLFATSLKFSCRTSASSTTVTLTSPSGRTETVTSKSNLAILNVKDKPEAGEWRVCASSGTLDKVRVDEGASLNADVYYLNNTLSKPTENPPPGCTSGRIMIPTKKASLFGESTISLVKDDTKVKTAALVRCGDGLFADLTFPAGRYTYEIDGKDNAGRPVDLNIPGVVTFASCSTTSQAYESDSLVERMLESLIQMQLNKN